MRVIRFDVGVAAAIITGNKGKLACTRGSLWISILLYHRIGGK